MHNVFVLVTGAAGFLGRRVLTLLAESGTHVLGVDVNPLAQDLLRDYPRAHFLRGDLANPDVRAAVLKEVTHVCHAAAFVPPNLEDPVHAKKCVEINALLTLDLLREGQERGVRHFTYCSSGAVYRRPSCGRAVCETDPCYPSVEATYYSASKLLAELWCDHFREAFGLRLATVRLGSLYGQGMRRSSAIPVFMECAFKRLPLRVLDGGRATFDYTFVGDAADLLCRIILSETQGTYNAGSGRAVSVLELADMIRNMFNDPKITLEVEPPSSRPRVGMPALDISKAASQLGYKPRSLEEGLRIMKAVQEQSVDEMGHI